MYLRKTNNVSLNLQSVIIRDIGFSSPGLSCGLSTQAVKYCGTVTTNKTRMSMSLREKNKTEVW